MTRKHFEKVAKSINERGLVIKFDSVSTTEAKLYGLWILRHLMHDLASDFSTFNNNFNVEKFYDACDIDSMYDGLRETQYNNR